MSERPSNFEKEKLMMEDKIQGCHNQIQYARSLNSDQLLGLKKAVEDLEKEYKEFFGEEGL